MVFANVHEQLVDELGNQRAWGVYASNELRDDLENLRNRCKICHGKGYSRFGILVTCPQHKIGLVENM